MSRYHGRHAARHAAPSRPRTTRAMAALRRPAVSGGLVLAVIGTGAAGVKVGDAPEANAAASFSVSSEALDQANEQANVSIEDTKRLTEDHNGAVALAAANAGRSQEKARQRAAKLAAERKATAERAARAAQRKKLLATAQSNPKGAARALLGDYGFSDSQFSCLEQLWNGESMWNYKAFNAGSGATGIPQALPGSKMASAGSDWQTNPATQIKWGLGYIKNTYGTPCNAWNIWQSRSPHWY